MLYLKGDITSVENYLYDNNFTFDTKYIDIFIVERRKDYAHYTSDGDVKKFSSIPRRNSNIQDRLQKKVRSKKINDILDGV